MTHGRFVVCHHLLFSQDIHGQQRWSRVENDQVDFIRAQNVNQLPQNIQFHLGGGNTGEVNRDIHVAQGAALASGESAE